MYFHTFIFGFTMHLFPIFILCQFTHFFLMLFDMHASTYLCARKPFNSGFHALYNKSPINCILDVYHPLNIPFSRSIL